ncbi:hypothetical protein FA13DRAFT_1713504 [Coprinellus micaceus]|uniref:Fungal-type protein kinase domain-containing protein n=1 Tax=Coprinellus micaceus TaxID=71717 RepID=A0A4Y7SW28_COPMI|nr:hypothetical protein FA13DRAFT_1713504 [Coprinellus micaceus]
MKAIRRNLNDEVLDYVHTDHDLLSFVTATCHLPVDTAKKILNASFTFPATAYTTYDRAVHETQYHEPFMEIAFKLVQDAAALVGETPSSEGYWNGMGTKCIIQDKRYRKPDLMLYYEPVPTSDKRKKNPPTWVDAKCVVEFKHNPKAVRCKARPATSRSMASVPRPSSPLKGKGKRTRSDSSEDDEQKSDAESGEDYDDGDDEIGEDEDEGGEDDDKSVCEDGENRIYSNEGSKKAGSRLDGETISQDNKKARVDQSLMEGEIQLGCYALETLAATLRFWVIGILLDKKIVTACYFDRHLVVCTEIFSFSLEPQKLALVLYTINQCSPTQLGFDPHLRPWSLHTTDEITPEMMTALNRPVKDPIGSFIEYTPSEIEEVGPGEDPELPVSLRIEEVLQRPEDLISRGTLVYKVVRRLSDSSYSDEKYAYKLSWPLAKRKSEFYIVKLLKERLPEESHTHFPQFLFTVMFTSETLKLPWRDLSLELRENNHQERVLRGLLGTICKKLWEVGSAENFRTAFLDCVKCHHLAWYRGGVLHRDISEHNVMITKSDSGGVVGVLNDWDMAKLQDDKVDISTVAHHRTCSPPTMAMDLLSGICKSFYYRLDLESFFWLLVWAAVHYNLLEGTRDPCVASSLVSMTLGTEANLNRKAALTDPANDGEAYFRKHIKVKPAFKGIFEDWIIPLRKLFCHARSLSTAEDDPETLGGRITFKRFMKILTMKDDGYRTWGLPDFLKDKD